MSIQKPNVFRSGVATLDSARDLFDDLNQPKVKYDALQMAKHGAETMEAVVDAMGGLARDFQNRKSTERGSQKEILSSDYPSSRMSSGPTHRLVIVQMHPTGFHPSVLRDFLASKDGHNALPPPPRLAGRHMRIYHFRRMEKSCRVGN